MKYKVHRREGKAVLVNAKSKKAAIEQVQQGWAAFEVADNFELPWTKQDEADAKKAKGKK